MPQIKVIAFWASIAATFMLLSSTQVLAQESNLYRFESNFYADSLFKDIYFSVHRSVRPDSWKEDGTYLASLVFSETSEIISIDLLQLEGTEEDKFTNYSGLQSLVGRKPRANFSSNKLYLVPITNRVNTSSVALSDLDQLNHTISFLLKICQECVVLPLFEVYRSSREGN